jgi:1-acyl-sn-glycerol-3-phosphate acyltransferase
MSERKKFTREDYFDSAMDDYPWWSKVVAAIVICVVGAFFKIVWPWRIEQGKLLWNDHEPRIIIMNHVSFLETIIPSISMWFRGHHVRPVYKSEYESNAFLAWLLPQMGGIPIDRGTADMKAVKRASRCLKRGESVLVFPEGTRVKSDDQPVEIHGGFALIARMAKVDVQPMAVVGARDIMRSGKPLRIFWRVFFKVGERISFDELAAESRHERTEMMEREGMERVYALRAELREEHPGKN